MIKLLDAGTAPHGSREHLTSVEKSIGFTPNLFRALAHSPSTIEGFIALLAAYNQGTFTDAERQIVQLAASLENDGRYCVAGHSAFLSNIKLPAETITAIRAGHPIVDKRQQALVDFTRVLVRERGKAAADDKTAFEAAGFTTDEIFEVIAGIALKTISNFVDNVFDLPVDKEFEVFKYEPEIFNEMPGRSAGLVVA